MRDKLIAKYGWERGSNPHPTQYTLHSVLSFNEFEDIEHVLQCLKEIDNFFTNSRYGGRYLQSRHPQFRSDPSRQWELNEFIKLPKTLREMIENDVFENYSWKHSVDKTLGKIYDQLFEVIKNYSKDIRIFTTNYDRAIEVYCSNEDRSCQCIDGFKYKSHSKRHIWVGEYNDPLVKGETNVYLYKLHGSLNWKKHTSGEIVATTDERRSTDPNYTDHLLVFPTLSPKDGQEAKPYKTIRKYFREFMKTADVCIIIGFSFRDKHINSIFSDFIKRGGSLIIVSPSADQNISENFLKKPLLQPSSVSWSQDRSINLYENNGTLITINQKITPKNSGRITQYVGAALQELSADKASEK